MRSAGEMDPVAMNTTMYFIWKVAYCCHMDSNCIGITNGLSYIGLHYRLYKKAIPAEVWQYTESKIANRYDVTSWRQG